MKDRYKLEEFDEKERKAIFLINQSKSNMKYIHISDEELEKIHQFALAKAIAKRGEKYHVNDNDHEYKRAYTGMLGEVAMAKFFGIDFVDWSIGDSRDYNYSDLKALGYRVGIKCVEIGKTHLIYKKSYYPELICVRKDTHTVILCGLATKDVLNNNQSDDYVWDPKVISEGRKSAFIGFDKLLPVNNIDDLKSYKIK